MGPFSDPDIAAALARIVKSPRVQYGVNSLKGTIPFIGGPMSTNAPIGASSRPRNSQMITRHSRVGETFGSSIARALSQGGAQQQQQDPMMSLYEQLISQLQQPVDMPQGIDSDDLMNQIRSALDPIYDQRASEAQSRSDRGRADVKNMYRALSDDYERLAPQQVAQAAAAKEEIEALYGQLRSNIEGNYARVSSEQGELFKQLGIEAALPDVLDDQQAAVTEASIAASENQAQQEQRYTDIGQMDATYYRQGSPLSTMRGNEISTDMLAELENYLQKNEAERTSGIQTAFMDQMSNAQSQLMQQQQMAQSEAGRRQEMLWQMLQGQMQGKQQQALTPDSFMGSLPGQQQQSVAGAFTRLQRSPEAVYGKVEDKRNPVPGTFVETTPQWYMAQADEMLRRGEIDAVTHQALLMYMQLYFGNK